MTLPSLYDQLPSLGIPQLLSQPQQTLRLEVEGYFPDFPTLTPIQGWLTVRHGGTYLELATACNTITTLTCNRCLGQYNYRLALDTQELIWLRDETPGRGEDALGLGAEEGGWDDLAETLPPLGSVNLGQWLYEQLCLSLPSQQVCDRACPGIAPPQSPSLGGDGRWSALDRLRSQL
jgi:uncharacterized protein